MKCNQSRIWTRVAVSNSCDDNHYTTGTSSWSLYHFFYFTGPLVKCWSMVWETGVQSQVESYQRLKKWYLVPPCLTLSIIRYGPRVKWRNPRNGVAPSPTPRCCNYWKGSLWVTLDYGRQYYFLTFDFGKCFRKRKRDQQPLFLFFSLRIFFTSTLARGLLLDFKQKQFSSGLHDSSEYSGKS